MRKSVRKSAVRYSRFIRLASKVHVEMLEPRILLTGNPIAPPPLPSQPTPLQGVVGTPNSLDPFLLNGAYDFNSLSYNIGGTISKANGAGETIAIVDAYGSPTIIQDAIAFDAETFVSPQESVDTAVGGLSNYDAEGNFFLTVQKLAPTANTFVEDATLQAGWAKETSLDVEWAHAVAPGAHIVLVEAPSNQFIDMIDANVYAAHLPGVVAVSNSWGGPPGSTSITLGGPPVNPATLDGYFVTPTGHTDNNGMLGGVVFLAASGDTSTNSFPAASRNVLAVGGELTTIDLNGAIQNYGPWTGSGGGPSTTTPTYNNPLVALDADPQTGVWIYDSTPDPADGPTIQGGWSVIGGTSFSCPAWAATIAIIDQGLNLRGYGSMNNDQVLGLEPYDDRGTINPGDTGPTIQTNSATTPATVTVLGDPASGYGILGLAENDVATWEDLVQPPGTVAPMESSFPLWNHMTNSVTAGTLTTTTTTPTAPFRVPDIVLTPVNGNTGWGWPDSHTGNIGADAFDSNGAADLTLSARGGFIQDMVGGPVGLTFFSDAIDSLYFTQQPVNTQAGATITSTSPGIQVTAFTPVNNGVDTSFNGTVSISILENGTLVGTTTATAVNGVATFANLSIDQIGTFEFIASSLNVNPGYSNAFNVDPAAATQLVIANQPMSIWQFGPMALPVIADLDDQFGNVVPGSGVRVTVSINTGPAGGVLFGPTAVATQGGVATFAGLSANVPGSYTLIVSSAGVTSAISSAFAVVPVPVVQRRLFNGAALSPEAILFQQSRNSKTFNSAPPAAQVAQIINADNIGPALVVGSVAVVTASPSVAPSGTFAAVSDAPIGGSSLDSQLLDTTGSTHDKILLN